MKIISKTALSLLLIETILAGCDTTPTRKDAGKRTIIGALAYIRDRNGVIHSNKEESLNTMATEGDTLRVRFFAPGNHGGTWVLEGGQWKELKFH